MKKLLLLTLLVISLVSHSQTITIGDEDNISSQVPYHTMYNYSCTEQVYLASEVDYAGYIKAIKFRIAYAYNSDYTSNIAVYMKNVSRSVFANENDYEPLSPDDKVFEGDWTIPGGTDSWITIEFDTPFYYNGTDNLLVAIDKNSDDFAIRFFRYSENPNSILSYFSDDFNPDPYNLGSFPGFRDINSVRSNIQLVFGPYENVVEISSETLSVYPNPATDVIYLEDVENEMISIYDAMGRLVIQQVYTESIDVSSLAKGVYAVKTQKGIVRFVKV